MTVPGHMQDIFQKVVNRGWVDASGQRHEFGAPSLKKLAQMLQYRFTAPAGCNVEAWLCDYSQRTADISQLEGTQQHQTLNWYKHMLRAIDRVDLIQDDQRTRIIAVKDQQHRTRTHKEELTITADGLGYLFDRHHSESPHSPAACLSKIVNHLEGNIRAQLATAKIVECDEQAIDCDAALIVPPSGDASLVYINYKNSHVHGRNVVSLGDETTDYIRKSIEMFPRTKVIQSHDAPDRVLARTLKIRVNQLRRAAATESADKDAEEIALRSQQAMHNAAIRATQYARNSQPCPGDEKRYFDSLFGDSPVHNTAPSNEPSAKRLKLEARINELETELRQAKDELEKINNDM